MASQYTPGQRVQVADTVEELAGWTGTVHHTYQDEQPAACSVILDQDEHQLPAHFYDSELTSS